MNRSMKLLTVGLLALALTGCKTSPDTTGSKTTMTTTAAHTPPTADEITKYDAIAKTSDILITTAKGTIEFQLYPDDAPTTVANFMKLTESGFYNGLTFHRVVPTFVVQGGDPSGDGTGGPGYSIKAEFNAQKHITGTVAMARSQDPDSAGSQFYITLEPQPDLDNQYTVFGQVVAGMDVVQKITVGDIMQKVEIVPKKTN